MMKLVYYIEIYLNTIDINIEYLEEIVSVHFKWYMLFYVFGKYCNFI